MKKIGVIGCGIIGTAVAEMFKNKIELYLYDPNIENVNREDDKENINVLIYPRNILNKTATSFG